MTLKNIFESIVSEITLESNPQIDIQKEFSREIEMSKISSKQSGYVIGIYGNNDIYFLFDDENKSKVISYVKIRKLFSSSISRMNLPSKITTIPMVQEFRTINEFENNGLESILYEEILKKFNLMMSNVTITKKGFNTWKTHFSKENRPIMLYDTSNKTWHDFTDNKKLSDPEVVMVVFYNKDSMPTTLSNK